MEGRALVIGNRRIMTDAGIDTAPLDAAADGMRADGATAIFVAIDGKAAGIIAIADPIKASTPAAIAALKEAGIRVVMLTGDNATTARAVARQLGITDVEADVLPEDKGKVVARLARRGPRRRDGGRRRQRRARAGRRRCRHRHGHRAPTSPWRAPA